MRLSHFLYSGGIGGNIASSRTKRPTSGCETLPILFAKSWRPPIRPSREVFSTVPNAW